MKDFRLHYTLYVFDYAQVMLIGSHVMWPFFLGVSNLMTGKPLGLMHAAGSHRWQVQSRNRDSVEVHGTFTAPLSLYRGIWRIFLLDKVRKICNIFIRLCVYRRIPPKKHCFQGRISPYIDHLISPYIYRNTANVQPSCTAIQAPCTQLCGVHNPLIYCVWTILLFAASIVQTPWMS